MVTQKTYKLYCYVDETGQDTLGELFIVVTVIVAEERDLLRSYLEQAEKDSGIGKKKWMRAKTATVSRNKYLEAANSENFKNKIYYRSYTNTGTGAFEDLTVMAAAKAINAYRERHKIPDDAYKVTLSIDGLKRFEEFRISKALRDLGIVIRKVTGGRDESEPLIRLTDRIAGLVRESEESRQEFTVIRRRLEKQRVITNLN